MQSGDLVTNVFHVGMQRLGHATQFVLIGLTRFSGRGDMLLHGGKNPIDRLCTGTEHLGVATQGRARLGQCSPHKTGVIAQRLGGVGAAHQDLLGGTLRRQLERGLHLVCPAAHRLRQGAEGLAATDTSCFNDRAQVAHRRRETIAQLGYLVDSLVDPIKLA